MRSLEPKLIRQIFVLLLILVMGILIFRSMLPYLSGVLGAITIYVLLRKSMSKLVRRGWPPNLAATTLLLFSFVCILLPLAGVIILLGSKVGRVVSNSERVVAALKEQVAVWEDSLGYDLSAQIDTRAISAWLSTNLQDFAGGTFNMLVAIALMYFMLFYMFTNRQQLRQTLFEYIPISDENLDLIGKESRAMVRSNAIGIPLVAIAQGVVALIGFLIFGIENAFFWAGIVTIGSMIPFVGNLLGTIPVFILTLSNGQEFEAWGILLYGLIVVGATDNLIRLYVLRKLDNVHPLITLIGVIIGIPLFGFIGLIFGPLLVSLFMIIVRIYKKEYGKPEKGVL